MSCKIMRFQKLMWHNFMRSTKSQKSLGFTLQYGLDFNFKPNQPSPAQNIHILNGSGPLQKQPVPDQKALTVTITKSTSQIPITPIQGRERERERDRSVNPSAQDQERARERERDPAKPNRHGISGSKNQRWRPFRRALQGAHAPELHLRHLRRRRRLLRRKGQASFSFFRFHHFLFGR